MGPDLDLPDKLSLSVPLAINSYTSICSPRSKQKPTSPTRFLWWTLESSSISVLNSSPPCIEPCWALLMAIICPSGSIPLYTCAREFRNKLSEQYPSLNHPKLVKHFVVDFVLLLKYSHLPCAVNFDLTRNLPCCILPSLLCYYLRSCLCISWARHKRTTVLPSTGVHHRCLFHLAPRMLKINTYWIRHVRQNFPKAFLA